ncbi:hypothetical protein DFH27DRAFT_653421 [Peziza echinospora]|nr:hypothetical protein DFH27DRAFT_653421 [Peziza echinospora]
MEPITSPSQYPVAIVTGASSGLGLSLTHHLLRKNYHVVLADINPPPIPSPSPPSSPPPAILTTTNYLNPNRNLSTSQLPLPPSRTTFIRTDVASWDSQCSLFRQTYEKFGRIDFLAANAGILDTFDLSGGSGNSGVESQVAGVFGVEGGELERDVLGTIRKEAEEEEEIPKPNMQTLEVNFVGVVYGVWLARHYFLKNKKMKKEKKLGDISSDGDFANGGDGGDSVSGRIVITSSQSGIYGIAVQSIYCASKHALVGLTRSLGHPKSPYTTHPTHKILINAILPSFMQTNILPPTFFEQLPKGYITPMSTVLHAYDHFLPGGEKEYEAGLCAECVGEEVVFRDQVEVANELARACLGVEKPSMAENLEDNRAEDNTQMKRLRKRNTVDKNLNPRKAVETKKQQKQKEKSDNLEYLS